MADRARVATRRSGRAHQAVPRAPLAVRMPEGLARAVQAAAAGGAHVSRDAVTAIQRVAGNRAAQHVVGRTRLAASAPHVSVQRCGPVPCNCSDEERQAAEQQGPAAAVQRAVTESAGAGSQLDAGVRRRIEPGLGADLSAVRVHRDAQSDLLARSLDAEAFTAGSDIFFRSGAYDPSSEAGLRTIAHEAAHVVQQSQGPVPGQDVGGGLQVSEPSDAGEQLADRMAGRALDGSLTTGVPLQRQAVSTASPTVLQRKEAPAAAPAEAGKKSITDERRITAAEFKGIATLHQGDRTEGPKDFDRSTAFENLDRTTKGLLDLEVVSKWGKKPGAPPIVPKDCDPCEKLRDLDVAGCSVISNREIERCRRQKTPEAKRAFLLDLAKRIEDDPCMVADAVVDCLDVPIIGDLLGLGAEAACNNVCLPVPFVSACVKDVIRLAELHEEIRDLVFGVGIPEHCDDLPAPSLHKAKGKADVAMRTRFRFDEDGKMVLFGGDPTINKEGDESVISEPVTFTRTEIPEGGHVTLAPMLVVGPDKKNGDTFQHEFEVELNLKPKEPVEYSASAGPFLIDKAVLDPKCAVEGKIHGWYGGLPEDVRARVEDAEDPMKVIVVGHASETGKAQHNLTLSGKRRDRGVEVMADFAGSDAKIRGKAHGEFDVQHTDECPKERRVDIFVTDRPNEPHGGKFGNHSNLLDEGCSSSKWRDKCVPIAPKPGEDDHGGSGSGVDTSSLAGRPLVKYGYSNDNVKVLQAALNQITGAGLEEDGIFGKGTLAAVKEFQQSHGLGVDGVVGKNTWSALASAR